MRLLVTTQAVDANESALGFFLSWLEELAKRAEAVEVICLFEGVYDLPANVRVHSLGKEHGRAGKLRYVWRFLRLAWRLRHRYDAVFVHMNPEYLVLAGVLWRLWGKRSVLWYTHRTVNLKLRIAVAFANAVATAAPESLRLASAKIHVLGHGIDASAFATAGPRELHSPVALISVGRVTPIKRLEILLDALALLAREGIAPAVTLVGTTVMPGDAAYENQLKAKARELGIESQVRFLGSVPYERMPALYAEHDICVNMAPTGGIDKAVLEAMAAGAPPVVANRAFAPLLAEDAKLLLIEPTPGALAAALRMLIEMPEEERRVLSARLVGEAREHADLRAVIGRLIALYGKAG